jgi:type III secretory pathway component EscV
VHVTSLLALSSSLAILLLMANAYIQPVKSLEQVCEHIHIEILSDLSVSIEASKS